MLDITLTRNVNKEEATEIARRVCYCDPAVVRCDYGSDTHTLQIVLADHIKRYCNYSGNLMK